MGISNTGKAALKSAKLLDAEADYRAGVVSVNAIAQKYSIPESTLRREARKLGWTRVPADARRVLVAEAVRGEFLADKLADEDVRQIQIDAAEQDVQDMNFGLSVARKVLRKLHSLVDLQDDPRELKVIVEANRAAVETIRNIRSLDVDVPVADTGMTLKATDGIAELREAFAKRLSRPIEPWVPHIPS